MLNARHSFPVTSWIHISGPADGQKTKRTGRPAEHVTRVRRLSPRQRPGLIPARGPFSAASPLSHPRFLSDSNSRSV